MTREAPPATERESLLRRKEELQFLGTQFALHGAEVPESLVAELASVEARLVALAVGSRSGSDAPNDRSRGH